MDIKHNCPHCEETVVQAMPSWEALEQIEECDSCGQSYQYIDSEGGPCALRLIKARGEK